MQLSMFQDRRRNAIQELVRVLHRGGRALVYVWAFEQERNKQKSNYLKDAKLKVKLATSPGQTCQSNSKVADEFKPCIQSCDQQKFGKSNELHCDNESESAIDTSQAAMVAETSHCVSSSETDQSSVEPTTENAAVAGSVTSPETDHPGQSERNARVTSSTTSLPVHVNRTHFQAQDLLVPWHLRQGGGKKGVGEEGGKVGDTVYHRYYHVFVEGELERLCETLPNAHVVDSYYDKGNWCVIVEKM